MSVRPAAPAAKPAPALDREQLAHTQRLFPGGEALPAELAENPHHAAWEFATGRLLEEGDGRDLRWLRRHRTQAQLASWFERHAARGLSRRNRSFWGLVLDAPLPVPMRNPLWPLG